MLESRKILLRVVMIARATVHIIEDLCMPKLERQ